MSHDETIEQAAQVLSTYTTCDGRPYATELHSRQACALADAGLLARPLPTKEGLEDTISDVLREPFNTYADVADAVLALLKGQEA